MPLKWQASAGELPPAVGRSGTRVERGKGITTNFKTSMWNMRVARGKRTYDTTVRETLIYHILWDTQPLVKRPKVALLRRWSSQLILFTILLYVIQTRATPRRTRSCRWPGHTASTRPSR